MSTETTPKTNYKETLNLPKTTFAMEAKLTQNEPGRLARWTEGRLYEKIMTARAKGKKWVLHDGPPFANGDVHIGHVINHVLKDVVVRFRTMQGYCSPYVPGWDCHGLPIEYKIQEKIGPKIRSMPPEEVRRLCHAYAQEFIDKQRKQLQRLGVLGDWQRPYVTMDPMYEASQLEVFAKFVEADLVFKKLRPVPWSTTNQTALAEHELEYKDVDDPSIFVEFPATQSDRLKDLFKAKSESKAVFLVWTTTPWTLPANLAIAVHPENQYVAVRYTRGGVERVGVVVTELLDRVFKDRKVIEQYEVVGQPVKGAEIVAAGLEYAHPFIDRVGKILPAMYVTTADGTGLVHTAPGHGVEDYATGQANGLPPYSPVMGNGRFDDTAPEFLRGKTVWEGNPLVIETLRANDLLLDQQTIRHSYPHDWRSKKPVIQRAAEQWFIALDREYVTADEKQQNATPKTLRARAMHAINHDVTWIPEWGSRRITGMVEGRPDWSISRQRFWGLPIPVFYNSAGEALLTPESVRAVAKHFREHGSDVWFTKSAPELLGADFKYPPKFSADDLRKEQDTFDVGFDSGSSWHCVLHGNANMQFPAEMYLEGSDQHRLWFQLSLLSSLGATGKPPFKQVLTHGFVVKPDGTKVSKSDKEYVTATKEIDTHGADLLRLWCCSVDYENDIPTSPAVIKEFGDKYRKIRNTLRYLISNLYDFNPQTDAAEAPLNSLDGWAMAELDQLIVDTTAAYESYQFHRVFRLLHDFCAVQISASYGNAMKDRLYCDAANSPLRRRCQTVLHAMLVAITKLLAPMLMFTADEIWESLIDLRGEDAHLQSVHLCLLPQPSGRAVSEAQQAEWKLLMDLRNDALGQLDKLTRQIGKYKALDAEAIYHVDDDEVRRRLQAYGVDLEDLVGTGFHSFAEKGPAGPAVVVEVVDRREKYPACARSWKRRPDVGQDARYPDLTLRDAAAVAGRGSPS